MRLKSSFLFILILFCLVSCDKKRVFDDYKSVGNAWARDSIVEFDFKQEDTTQRYNLFVNLRANQSYQFSNLYVIVAMQRPGGLVQRRRAPALRALWTAGG
ncbi:MAG: hypothetical protein EOP00_31220, partial [Pedobacter sp.]